MLIGIELMLKRMETHPEEFVGVNGGCSREWYAVVTPVIPYLTDEEREVINTALGKAYRDHFNAQTLKKIAGESVMSDRERQFSEDYYGRSLTEMIRGSNGTSASTLGAQAQVIKTYPKLAPSAFGAVPVSSSTVTLTGSSS